MNPKKYLFILMIITAIVLSAWFLTFFINQNPPATENNNSDQTFSSEEKSYSIANPAAQNCKQQGGKSEIITEKDGSQYGLCVFDDYSCDEWVLYREECTLKEDAALIKQALTDKGLNLDDMKIVIYKHLGKYIEAGVVPVSAPAGGGYVFAAKENGAIKILADGNGAIACSTLANYPDFPTYLIPECIDATGNPVAR